MEELQKNTEPEDSKEELNTSEGIAQELLKTAKKQLFYTRLSTCFVGVMAAAIVISLFSVGFILVEMKVEFWLSAVILIVLFGALVKSIKKQKI